MQGNAVKENRAARPAILAALLRRTDPFSAGTQLLRRVVSQPRGALGLAIVLLVVLAALFAHRIVPYDPAVQVLSDALLQPSPTHLIGTDEFGRDVFSRVVHGARASLQVGLISIVFSTVIGTLIGQIAGYCGGRPDEALMRIVDALLSFPALMLALIINAILGASLTNAIVAIAIVTTPGFARLARGETLAVRESEFVQAARALGASNLRILFRHILANIQSSLIVNASNQISGAIITEGSLSFLGLGVQPPLPSWGSMLRAGYGYLDTSPWLVLGPTLAIMVTVLGFNVLGDACQDASDPGFRQQRSVG